MSFNLGVITKLSLFWCSYNKISISSMLMKFKNCVLEIFVCLSIVNCVKSFFMISFKNKIFFFVFLYRVSRINAKTLLNLLFSNKCTKRRNSAIITQYINFHFWISKFEIKNVGLTFYTFNTFYTFLKFVQNFIGLIVSII